MHGLHIIKTPSGLYVFVGSVPASIGYIRIDGTTPTSQEVVKALRVPGSRSIVARTFSTSEQANAFARAHGFIPDSRES